MMKLKAALFTFIVLGLSFTIFQVFIRDHPLMITQQEAKDIATELYGGKVLHITPDSKNSHYQIEIENDKGIYQLFVDGKTNKISDVKLIERKEPLPIDKGVNTEPAAPSNGQGTESAAPTPISRQQAKEIALQQIDGKITNISMVTTQRGHHYKVTVDGPSENAHVYVHAITGKVAPISWYSNDDNDGNDDDDDGNDDDDDDDDDDDGR
ncbi:PepSY domain-containing protein [Paenibacillus tarimensis]